MGSIGKSAEAIVFSRDWFLQRQRTLCGLCNHPLTRWGTRQLLDIELPGRVVSLLPHAVTVQNGEQRTLEVHAGNRYANRMYRQLRGFWELAHWFDMKVANPYCPALNLGYDTLTVYPDADPETNSVDGWFGIQDGFGTTWVALHDGVGSYVDDSTGSGSAIYFESDGINWFDLRRSAFVFLTGGAGLLQVTDTINSATFSFYGTAKVDDIGLSANFAFGLYSANVVATALETNDFGDLGTTSYATAIAYAGYNTGGYNDMALNGTGLAAVSKTGTSQFGVRESYYDAAYNSPSAGLGTSLFAGYFADNAGTGNDPKLTIDYTRPVSFVPQVWIM